MAGFVAGLDRGQATLLPECLEDWVDDQSETQIYAKYILKNFPNAKTLFRSENAQNRSPETGGQFAEARHWRAFLRVSGIVSPGAGLPGWRRRNSCRKWSVETN
jgi:hypothetical protein